MYVSENLTPGGALSLYSDNNMLIQCMIHVELQEWAFSSSSVSSNNLPSKVTEAHEILANQANALYVVL